MKKTHQRYDLIPWQPMCFIISSIHTFEDADKIEPKPAGTYIYANSNGLYDHEIRAIYVSTYFITRMIQSARKRK